MSLRPCIACHRHIRASARACPFCQPTLAAAIAIGLAFAACGGNPAPPAPAKVTPDARPDRGDTYGVPQQRDARPVPTPDAAVGPDASRGPAAPIYGVPERLLDAAPPAPPDATPQATPRPKKPKPPRPDPQPMYGVPRDPD